MVAFILLGVLVALAVWVRRLITSFDNRLTEAEDRRFNCRHDSELDGYMHTVDKIMEDTVRLSLRQEELAAKMKSLKGSIDHHARRVSWFANECVVDPL